MTKHNPAGTVSYEMPTRWSALYRRDADILKLNLVDSFIAPQGGLSAERAGAWVETPKRCQMKCTQVGKHSPKKKFDWAQIECRLS